ncbi:MAG: N-formylglutamate amidohydrolase [Sandaracinaceae bacterium]|nr:N-formylglutamate amidohydrolase [Sandaracinaceae bacterium]MBK7772838.1 N-formylglutamate amidohydrolase [Sandaracinaceae bacterium]MBK8407046.1 N-formylglutamate amidohydrolase [Sandaracinaceae bacterium]MBP7680539.1 N-formylglutamate amidohydrolase [Deltaproteobacteria bacterium]
MAPILSTLGDAAEVLGGRADVALVLCCEHASERLPGRWRWSESDRRLVGTHWALDLGAADLTRELADHLGAPGVLARFSRLLCDPNRPEDSDTLFRTVAEGQPVELNAALSDADRRLRLTDYYRPYHAALDATLGASLAPMLFAVHSFTPMYEGQPRAMELGVLFNREPALGYALTEHLSRAGYVTHANEPWSGQEGFMYSPDAHALRHGRRALELEVRQDLCTDAAYRARLIRVLADFFARV